VKTYLKEQLEHFLEAVDAALNEPVEMIVIGGTAAALHYGVKHPTRDIDTWNAINASLAEAVKKAREVTGLEVPMEIHANSPLDLEILVQRFDETDLEEGRIGSCGAPESRHPHSRRLGGRFEWGCKLRSAP